MEYKEQNPLSQLHTGVLLGNDNTRTRLSLLTASQWIGINSKKLVIRPVRQGRLKDEIKSSRFPRFLSIRSGLYRRITGLLDSLLLTRHITMNTSSPLLVTHVRQLQSNELGVSHMCDKGTEVMAIPVS